MLVFVSSKFLSHSNWSITTILPTPDLLDFPRNISFKKSLNIGEVWAVDAITLNFFAGLDFTTLPWALEISSDFSSRFFKWRHVKNEFFGTWFSDLSSFELLYFS